ncbi:hypothetical protein K7432_013130 [Basidiobolus ranarum]|uniref:C2H2-type domain-containing protein n=1 Tax=Basidiobolus ranarum TaxID=34480 RepID=A0ABR2WJQ2_9FUNG
MNLSKSNTLFSGIDIISGAEDSLGPRFDSSGPLNIKGILNSDSTDQPLVESVEYETSTSRTDFSPCNINFLLNPDPYDESNELNILATDSSIESDGEPLDKGYSEATSDLHDRTEAKDSKGTRVTGRKYECNVCQKHFNRPSTLKTHMYSHTGERPFVCHYEGCNKRFSVESNLRRHLRIHYPESRNLRTKWIHTFVKK